MVSRGAEISSGAVWDSLKPLDYLQNHFRSFIIAKAHLGVKTGSTEVIRKVDGYKVNLTQVLHTAV